MVFDKGSFDPLTRCLDADISSDDSSFLMDDFECLRLLATTPEKVVQCSAEHDTCATQRYVDVSHALCSSRSPKPCSATDIMPCHRTPSAMRKVLQALSLRTWTKCNVCI